MAYPNMPKIPDDQKPAIGKVIAPAALFYFRWAAMVTLVTGLIVAHLQGYLLDALMLGQMTGQATIIGVGMWLAIIMWFNVWFVIWPNQKIICGIVPGDAAAAGPKALLASRTNVLFSAPMLLLMGSSAHLHHGVLGNASGTALGVSVAIIAALELNAIKGKLWPAIATVRGVIHGSIALSVVLWLVMSLL